MKHLFIFSILFLAGTCLAQKPLALGKYLVRFTDKENNPYCVCRPWEFLSARALARREKSGIPVLEEDLPVNPFFLDSLRAQNVQIHHALRWLNAATLISDSLGIKRVRQLPFVRSVEYLGRHIVPKTPDRPQKKRRVLDQSPKAGDGGEPLGYAGLQQSLLGMPLLYYAGVRGNGIWVAVMDGGFNNVDTMPFFDSIALQGRLYPGWDFVDHDGGIYESAQHGTAVLSVMAANLPGYFVGDAPEATYFLLKTEDTAGEFPVEESNWIAGAEWADSMGVDVINASLGYTSFSDTTLNHKYAQLDGRSTLGAQGARIATQKGMIICNSAGNSGDEAWKYIGVPADAAGIIAVGAIRPDGKRADFSSFGPTADGRIKPDLVAPGEQVVVAGDVGTELGLSNGTSLASPMLAGAFAALWSDFPELSAQEIENVVFESADQYQTPNNERGYGLPNFGLAWMRLHGFWFDNGANRSHQEAFFAGKNKLQLLFFEPLSEPIIRVELLDLQGSYLEQPAIRWKGAFLKRLEIQPKRGMTPGVYRIRLIGQHNSQTHFCIWWD